ncbi:MAG: hypothetical protein WC788_08085 [Candidatus Paceibacterota bacterium]|jgi:hypothetical protein
MEYKPITITPEEPKDMTEARAKEREEKHEESVAFTNITPIEFAQFLGFEIERLSEISNDEEGKMNYIFNTCRNVSVDKSLGGIMMTLRDFEGKMSAIPYGVKRLDWLYQYFRIKKMANPNMSKSYEI